jgi:hypothetical protein
MKKDLINQLSEILNHDDVFHAKHELKHLSEEFEKEKEKALEEEKEAFSKAHEALTEEEKEEHKFEAKVDSLDEEFENLHREIRYKIKEKEDEKRQALTLVYKNKLEIIAKVEALVHEENIAKAFSSFNELKEDWKNTGQASRTQEKEVHDKHNAVVKEFYYNMNIYKELKAYDFDKNYKIRCKIIEDLTAILKLKSIKEKQDKYHKLREKWYDAGPVSRDQYEELHQNWKDLDDKIHDELGEFYDKLHIEQKENLEKKKSLVEKVKSVVIDGLNSHAKWQKQTKEVLDIQAEWKKIGFARRRENETIWKDFREECDHFFEAKQKFYDVLKVDQDKNKAAKLALVDKAIALKKSEDWKEASHHLIKLQKEWKMIAPTHHRDEKKLWNQFREACNHFFNHKKEHFSHLDDEQVENLKLKNEVIESIGKFEVTDDKKADIMRLKSFSDHWNKIGHVPFKEKDKLNKNYQIALDVHYTKIKLNDTEKIEILFQNKVDQLAGTSDPENSLHGERNYLREKINRLNSDLIQYENNMGFINTSDTNNVLLKGLNKNLEKTQAEIDKFKAKLEMVNKALRAL